MSNFQIRPPVTQVFTSSITYTPSVGMRYAIVEMVGGGGGGGSPPFRGANISESGAPGNGGGYLKFMATAAQIGASLAITIGAAGTAVTGSAGGAGGTTSFGALATCTGGGGGTLGGALTGQPAAFSGSGAQGTPTLTTGTLIVDRHGGRGSMSMTNNNSQPVPQGAMLLIGVGGNTPLGVGSKAVGQQAIPSTTFLGTTNPYLARGYGSGGGGAVSDGLTTGTGAWAAQPGMPGIVIVTEYFH